MPYQNCYINKYHNCYVERYANYRLYTVCCCLSTYVYLDNLDYKTLNINIKLTTNKPLVIMQFVLCSELSPESSSLVCLIMTHLFIYYIVCTILWKRPRGSVLAIVLSHTTKSVKFVTANSTIVPITF